MIHASMTELRSPCALPDPAVDEIAAVLDAVAVPTALIAVEDAGACRYLHINRAFERASRTSLEDARGRAPTELWQDDDSHGLEQRCRACIAADTPLEQDERHAAEPVPIAWRTVVAPLTRAPDGSVRVIATSSERTAGSAMHDTLAELREAHENLEHFVSVASHDLKSPINNIKFLVEMIEEDLAAGEVENVKGQVAKARRVAVAALDLLEKLRVFANIRRTEERPIRFRVGELVDEVTAMLAGREGFAIRFEQEDVELTTWWTPLLIVLKNLVENAIRHHDRETGTIAIEAAVAEDQLRLRIVDDGPGIPAKYRDGIFQPFKRFSPAGRSHGHGMGLAIIRRLVDIQGGGITVDVAEGGRGTVFEVIWPLGPTPRRKPRHQG